MTRDFLGDYRVSADLTFAKGVLLLDQCGNTLPWYIYGDGTDFDIAIKREAAFFGNHGIRLRTKATTPAENNIVTARRMIPFPETNLLVYRLLINTPEVAKTKAIFIRADFNDGSRAYAAALKWLPNGPYLQYLNAVGNYETIQGYDQDASDEAWISIEVVVKLATHEYVSCTFNGIKTSLKDLGIYDEAAVNNIYHYFEIGNIANAAYQSEIYFDSVYIGEFLNI